MSMSLSKSDGKQAYGYANPHDNNPNSNKPALAASLQHVNSENEHFRARSNQTLFDQFHDDTLSDNQYHSDAEKQESEDITPGNKLQDNRIEVKVDLNRWQSAVQLGNDKFFYSFFIRNFIENNQNLKAELQYIQLELNKRNIILVCPGMLII